MKIKGRLKLVYQPLREQSAWRRAADASLYVQLYVYHSDRKCSGEYIQKRNAL